MHSQSYANDRDCQRKTLVIGSTEGESSTKQHSVASNGDEHSALSRVTLYLNSTDTGLLDVKIWPDVPS